MTVYCALPSSSEPCGHNKRKFIQADRNITPSTITLYLGVLFYDSIPLGITTERSASGICGLPWRISRFWHRYRFNASWPWPLHCPSQSQPWMGEYVRIWRRNSDLITCGAPPATHQSFSICVRQSISDQRTGIDIMVAEYARGNACFDVRSVNGLNRTYAISNYYLFMTQS